MGKVNSRHVVGLSGYCVDGNKRLLVYEYMENGSLQEALFDEMYGTSLDWDLRFKIILDTARGLASLHYDCDPPIIHGDVKPSNILLDKHFAARIADFGLARLKSEETETIAHSEAIQREHIERERIRYERNERKRTRRTKRKHADARRKRSMDNLPLEKSPLSPATSANDFITPGDMVRRDGYATSHDSETMTGTEEASPYRLEFDPSRVRSPLSVLPSTTTRQSSPSIPQESRIVDPPSSLAASIVEIMPSDAEKSIRESAISPSDGYRDDVSLESGRSERELRRGSRTSQSKKLWNRDWWWPQDTNSGELTLQDFINWAPTRSIASSKGERKNPGSKESAGGAEGSGSITPISQSLRADKQNQGNGSRSSFASDHGWGESGDESTGRKKKDKQRNDKIWERRREEKNEELGKSKGRHAKSKSRDSFRSSGGKTKIREWWREDKSEATLSKNSPVLGRLTARKKEDKRGKGERTKRDWWKEEKSERVGTSKTKHAKSNSSDNDGVSSRVGNSKTRESWREESNNDEMGQTKLMESSPLAASKPPESVSGQSLRKKASGRKKKSRIRDCFSGDLPGRAAATSTPSMRGTTCYLAPESGGGGILNEKGDVYSFGVLLLVIIAGRRPIQVMASPISEFEKANLVSWARHLARSGNVLDLVDGVLEGQYSKEQVVLCTTLALLCLQRLPSLRPTMGDVVKILLGESNLPSLPVNFSPSPSNFPSRRRKSSAGRVPAPSVVSLP